MLICFYHLLYAGIGKVLKHSKHCCHKQKNEKSYGTYGGVILMGFSKAFDTINHDLLTAKLVVDGFETESLKLIKSLLTNPLKRTK